MTILRALLLVVAISSCGSDSTPPPPAPAVTTGASCTVATTCYPGVDRDAGAIPGQITCLTKVAGGYCTHTCSTDADCRTVAGDYRTGHLEVCSPFESTADTYCLLSCEATDLADAGVADPNAYCTTYATAGMSCRSSGGGSQNRKICML
jgi:hypothetical protein